MKVSALEALWVNSPLRAWMQRRDFRRLARLADLRPGGVALEVGCGRGVGIDLIHRTFRPALVLAVDVDPTMVRLAHRRHRRHADVVVRLGDAQRLPFADATVDSVFEFGIIHHLPDWRAGVEEIARVLRLGGRFCFEEIYPALYANTITRALLTHPRRDRFSGPQLRTQMRNSGLRLLPGWRESRWRILGVAVRA